MRLFQLLLPATLAGLALTACAAADHPPTSQTASTLTVRGSLTIRERIALSPAAVAEVTLSEEGRASASPVVARQTIPFNGRQVPIAFSLGVDRSLLLTGRRYTLRGTIQDHSGSMRWVADTPFSANLTTLSRDVGMLLLVREESPGGAAPSPPTASSYRARGNEPGWVLDFGNAEMSLIWNTGQNRMTAPLPVARADGASRRYETRGQGRTLVVDIVNQVCRDTMSGMSYPDRVTVTIDGQRLEGCGGRPASLLEGGEWIVESIGGAPLVRNSRVTLAFGADGRVTGSAGCNRFGASYTLTGEDLSIGVEMTSTMACDTAVMTQEDRFLGLLGRTREFEIPATGTLALVTGDGQRIVARR